MDSMKVVIPGGSGFLGRSVAKQLVADEHEPAGCWISLLHSHRVSAM